MEEVWENISSICNPNSTPKPPNPAAFSSVGGVPHLYDFFNLYPNTNQKGFVENPSSSSQAKKKPLNNEHEAAKEKRRLRLIRNREAADRSRARRQAYIIELEEERDKLKKENVTLKHELEMALQEKVRHTSSAAVTTTRTLRRTLTASF